MAEEEKAIVEASAETKKAEELAKVVAAKSAKNPTNKPQKKFLIVIGNQQGQSGKDPIFLGDNGRDFLLPRETQVEVTESMINGLRSAISHETEEYKGEDGRTQYRQRPFQLYPFEIVKEIEG